jgi:hypothetical protein
VNFFHAFGDQFASIEIQEGQLSALFLHISQDLVTRKLEASHVLGMSSRPLCNIHMIRLANDKRLFRSLELTWGIIKHDFLSL